VELLLGGNRQAAGIGHGDEVAQMPELHHNLSSLVGPSLAGRNRVGQVS
jgi:hypothetical protein